MAIQVVETSALQSSGSGGPLMMPLAEAGQGRALLLNLEAGVSVAPCQMSVTVLYFVIAGQGRLRVGEDHAELKDGSLVVVPAGAVRSISAHQRMRVLAVQIP